MGAGHSDADFDAELGTQETFGGNKGTEPSPMKGMIYEVAVWCSNQCRHGDGLSPHNPARGELHARETQWTKRSDRSDRDRHRRVMRRGKNRRWTGWIRGGHVLVKDGLCSPWPKQQTIPRKRQLDPFTGTRLNIQIALALLPARLFTHKNTTKSETCCGTGFNTMFTPVHQEFYY